MEVSTDSESLADASGMSDSEGEEMVNLSELRAPLDKGWKRETIIRGLTKNMQIRGDVCYYAPGSQMKLKHIGQIQTVGGIHTLKLFKQFKFIAILCSSVRSWSNNHLISLQIILVFLLDQLSVHSYNHTVVLLMQNAFV